MAWLISALILIAAFWLVPWSVNATKRSRKGRGGGVMASFADGIATALDPHRALIVEEMETRQNEEGEEADGDDEPLKG